MMDAGKMLGGLLSKYRTSQALKVWGNLGINALTKEYLDNSSLKGLSETTKTEITGGLKARLLTIITAENGFLALQAEIKGMGYYFAGLQVLALKEKEKTRPVFDFLPRLIENPRVPPCKAARAGFYRTA